MAIWICLSEGVICPVNILPMPLPVCLSAERENFCQMRKTLNYSVRSGWSQTRFLPISQEMVGRICFLPRSEIGRASCRERVEVAEGAGALEEKSDGG